ncbi:hypothetical protein [Apilactobacillus ozensis]|uniref:hypothetical protein n=1 Tax=Apilactobacillus ozensis TaxID=866801 RepID=UPI00200B7D1D|nr:hypothetical protein [Apilactobacillus ozensis]MCK8607223.1 hypothetical protein [Apilactobacillus ozensis]
MSVPYYVTDLVNFYSPFNNVYLNFLSSFIVGFIMFALIMTGVDILINILLPVKNNFRRLCYLILGAIILLIIYVEIVKFVLPLLEFTVKVFGLSSSRYGMNFNPIYFIPSSIVLLIIMFIIDYFSFKLVKNICR